MVSTAEQPTQAVGPTDVDPALLQTWMQSGDTIVIDVREDYEHAEERIDTAVSHPLSRFDSAAIRGDVGTSRVVFHCRSGKRSHDAASRYAGDGKATFYLAGGIEAWKSAGLDVIRPARGPRIPIMRQMQIVAGGLVTLGVALGLTVAPGFFGIAAFVGCGLMFAGISGWCGMAKLLAVMPWNRSPRAC